MKPVPSPIPGVPLETEEDTPGAGRVADRVDLAEVEVEAVVEAEVVAEAEGQEGTKAE